MTKIASPYRPADYTPAILSHDPAYSLFDRENPRSLISMVPDRIQPLLWDLRTTAPKILLQQECKIKEACKPDERDHRLRLSFWDEYDAACASNRRMTMKNILGTIIPFEIWSNVYERRKLKLLWIITQPRSYAYAMKLLLDKGIERMMEIMQMPIVDAKGRPDTRMIAQIIKAVQIIDLRVKGSILQKVQIQQQSLNINAEASDLAAQAEIARLASMSLTELEELDRKLEKAASIEAKMVRSLPEGPEKQEVIEIKREMDETGVGGLHNDRLPKTEDEVLDKEFAKEANPLHRIL